eukprot:g1154.t1
MGRRTAVLPLLQEQGGGTSTVEERVIGVGLQALEKTDDGAALKDLFHMFAVTKEDFVHPIAVVELLWRACCVSEAEEQEGGLMARLKVRQRTQILVDYSLLLGSSSEGIHLHDIVLTYLRRQSSVEETRELHTRVVDGMMAASMERAAATGSTGFEDTGETARAFEGEEVDWYCRNVGSYHVAQAIDPSTSLIDNEVAQHWLLQDDPVLVRAAALAVEVKELIALAEHFELKESNLVKAARIEFAASAVAGSGYSQAAKAHTDRVLALLERAEASDEAMQLELNVLAGRTFVTKGAEADRIHARIESLMQANSSLTIDLINLAFARYWPKAAYLLAFHPSAYDKGAVVNEESIEKAQHVMFQDMYPLLIRAAEQSKGARAESKRFYSVVFIGMLIPCLNASSRLSAVSHDFLNESWGPSHAAVMGVFRTYSYSRHFEVTRTYGVRNNFTMYHNPLGLPEHIGDMHNYREAVKLTTQAQHEMIKAAPGPGPEQASILTFSSCNPGTCVDVPDLERLVANSPSYAIYAGNKRYARSKDGRHHYRFSDNLRIGASAQLSLAALPVRQVDLQWLDGLPAPDTPTLKDTFVDKMGCQTERQMCAEVFELVGQLDQAMAWASADALDEHNHNIVSRVRSGITLGRCHAARGEHSLAVAACDAGLELARVGKFLFSEMLAVRSRAVAGREAGGTGLHWAEQTGRARLAEVVGRMQMPRGERDAMEARLWET